MPTSDQLPEHLWDRVDTLDIAEDIVIAAARCWLTEPTLKGKFQLDLAYDNFLTVLQTSQVSCDCMDEVEYFYHRHMALLRTMQHMGVEQRLEDEEEE